MMEKTDKCAALLTKAYVCAVVVMALGVVWLSSPSLPLAIDQYLAFGTLIVLGSLSQLFPVVSPKHQAYYVTIIFLFAGVVLLEPAPLAIFIVVVFLPEWIRAKYQWQVQLFNIANYLLDAFLARAVYVTLTHTVDLGSPLFTQLGAALAAVAVFTLLNHILLAFVLRLANGHTGKETGLFERESLFTDATLAVTGLITVLLWQTCPLLIVLMIGPVFLFYRALNTPNLQEQARKDGKTGLFNARHFWEVLREELHRARRFDRPLAVIMADMDLLRNVNNTYGHLAGDVVLKGIADIISGELREYDLAARFGGEEFAIVLPETDADDALQVAERMRRKVEAARFHVSTAVDPIRVTLSLGVASFPVHGWEANDVIHQADLAVYYAKLRGRNQAWVCSAESRALGAKVAGRSAEDAYEPSQCFSSQAARAPMEFLTVAPDLPTPTQVRLSDQVYEPDAIAEARVAQSTLTTDSEPTPVAASADELMLTNQEVHARLAELRISHDATLVALSVVLGHQASAVKDQPRCVAEYASDIAAQPGISGR